MGSIESEGDVRVEEEPGGARPTTYARFQFNRMEQWKRDQILKKQEEQNRLRRVLQEQVMEKKKREASERLREQEESRCQMPHKVLRETPSQDTIGMEAKPQPEPHPQGKVKVKVASEVTTSAFGRKTTRFSYENKDELQKAEIIRKQKEQELTRKLLAEQIEEKRKRKEAEREKEKASQPRYNAKAQHTSMSDLPKTIEREPVLERAESPKKTEEARAVVCASSDTEAAEEDETLSALRAQVKEQQKILREQAATMMDLREKASQAMLQRDDILSKGDSVISPTVSSASKKAERKRTRRRRGKKENERGFGVLGIRDVVLKRDAQGKLGVELAKSPHGRCIIARLRKTFVSDDRKKLRAGDLVLAIGNFKVRKLLRAAEEDGIESLHDLSEDIPRFKDVQHLFLKAGAVLKIAVCTVDMEVVEALLESDESCEDVDEEINEEERKPIERLVQPRRIEKSGSAYSKRYLLESTSQSVGREDWNNLGEVLQRGVDQDVHEEYSLS